ncbi:MAG TPA: phosphate ABC transporter permease PstA [Caldisericia bacterium]|nr:phosphate ABC transporter permease PstA [Caldisericia bacterium]HPI84371.1 phosphate ABC transporter permease PstA [Caldisericia bacterium]HPQ93597.1 phosphate ABC transporter permease PstA [Caldisericia bacterium]
MVVSRKSELPIFWLMRIVTYLIVLVTLYIVIDIVVGGLPAISWEFLTAMPRRSGTMGGIGPVILGTIYLIGGTAIIAIPLGIASAIYLAEYAKPTRFTNLIRLAITTLAGVPSIVFGLFGLGLFVLLFGFGTSVIAGSFTLACLIMPTIIVASEESIRAVPRAFREGALALGASKWQMIKTQVLPYSIPGMMTGSILGISRAAGETAPIMFTAAVFFTRSTPTLTKPVMALPFHLFTLSTQVPEIEKVRPMQYGTALVLISVVVGFSLIAVLVRTYYRSKYKW